MEYRSCADKLLLRHAIFDLVLLQQLFHVSENPLKTLTVKTGQSHLGHCLHTGLTLDIMEQGKLTEVVSFLVLVDNAGQLTSIGFLSHQLTLHNDVEFAARLTLVDDVLALLVFFFLKNIQELLSK
jgi:hypothetical protein